MAYTYTNFKDAVSDPIPFANIGSSITVLNSLNRAARLVNKDIDLRSTKRRAQLASKIFDDIFSYAAPADLKDFALIDFNPQANRIPDSRLILIPEEKFYRLETIKSNLIAVSTKDLTNKILAAIDAKDTVITPATFQSTTADGGTWIVTNDATNLQVDTDNYIKGGASLKFDLTGAATTAGISNGTLTTFDLTNYKDNGSAFIWIYINSTTNLTNWILEIGTNSTNYYTQTVTTDSASNAFVNGWNLLRFDFASMTQTGTVTNATCNWVKIYMTKTVGKSDDGYRVDDLTLHTGEYRDVIYYSKYAWRDTNDAFIENSTTSSDKLNADTDEFDIFVAKGKAEVFKDLRMWNEAKIYEAEYLELKKTYIKRNPSQRIRAEDSYYSLGVYNQRF